MLATFKIEFDEATKRRLEQFLATLEARAANIPGALKNIGEALLQTTRERFDSGKDPDGKMWQELAPLTVMLRRSSKPILLRTGRLRNSVSYNIINNRLELGPNTVDAAIHQFGGEIVPKDSQALRIPGLSGANRAIFLKKVTIPARPYIGFGEVDEQAATDALLDWLDIEQEARSV
ncbi:phage virion morphogenesis protein [Candidatus Tokpelaia sp.]|uniref:phage virion morphogenesis protein n=1 Tax=Candidatus Tokpelaia sp. TaxID=2233777 RepID=UPI00123889B9|nr:phage virion morphogenesis protein [Candidatus Tokpelaia sp.]KAA6404482.1 phage virion morphogenesis protein [Candidatus Tokpelaia sp.]